MEKNTIFANIIRINTNNMLGLFKESDALSEVICNDYRLLQVMSRFGISLGLGNKTIKEICGMHNVDCPTFLAVINFMKREKYGEPQPIGDISLEPLMDYLKQTHIYFLEFMLPSIRQKLLSAIDCSAQNEIAFLILKLYDEYVNEIRRHMEYEETNVFTYVKELLANIRKEKESFQLMSKHHGQIEMKLGELKNLFIKYYPQKENNNRLNAVVYDIYNCEEDLLMHCRLEDKLFTPMLNNLECNNISVNEHIGADDTELQDGSSILSNREKEIVVGVAKGLANKEISDKLNISIFTVTTHRRNIAAKLQIHSASGLTIYAIVNKLISIDEVYLR